jgi:hypothetical protein
MDPFSTPPGYFDALPEHIVRRTRTRTRRLRVVWASAAALAAGWAAWAVLLAPAGEHEPCATFACLLETTSTEDLLHDAVLEELAGDPEAFDVLTEDL